MGLLEFFVPKVQMSYMEDWQGMKSVWNVSNSRNCPQIFWQPHHCKIASNTRDSTIRLWDVKKSSEINILESGNESYCISVDFNSNENLMVGAFSDGMVQFFDPRAGNSSVAKVAANHNFAKGFKVSSSIYNHLYFTAGFDTKGDREIRSMDYRNLTLETGRLLITDSHASPLQPILDPDIPVLYVTSKNEGIRVVEYNSGSLDLVFSGFPTIAKQFTGVDLLSKDCIDKSKWELARFISLTNEKTVETLSLKIPWKKDRADVDSSEIYPVKAKIKPLNGEEWQNFKNIVEETPAKKGDLKRGATVSKGEAAQESTLAKTVDDRLLETTAQRVLRGWILNGYLNCVLSLYWDYLLLGDENMGKWNPISLGQITYLAVSTLDTIDFRCNAEKYSFKFKTIEECKLWLEKINSNIALGTVQISMKAMRRSMVSAYTLSGKARYSTLDANKATIIEEKLLATTEDGLILIFNSMEAFLKKQPPAEAIPIKSITAIQQNSTGFTAVTASRRYMFHDVAGKQEWTQLLFEYNQNLTKYLYGEGEMNVDGEDRLVILQKQMIQYYEDGTESIPVKILSSADLFGREISVKKENNKFSLIVTFKNGPVVHQFDDEMIMEKWKGLFSEFMRLNHDILKDYGLDSNATTKELMHSSTVKKTSDGILYVDSRSRKEMRSKIMYRITHRNGLCIDSQPCEAKVFTADCCYVFESKEAILVYRGPETSRILFADAHHIQHDMRKADGNRPKIVSPEDDDYTMRFTRVFPTGIPTKLPPIANDVNPVLAVYLLDSNDMKMDKIFEGFQPSKVLLSSCAIVECDHEIFVWFGTGALSDAKNYALLVSYEMARKLKSRGKQFVVHYEETESMESVLFKRKFKDFPSELPIGTHKTEALSTIAKEEEQPELDLAFAPIMKSEVDPCEMLPSGGKLTQYLIQAFEKIPVGDKEVGIFLRNKSYVISYIYQVAGKSKCYLFFWQGSLSKVIEKGTSAMITVEMSKSTGFEVSQHRVIEGKEPAAFKVLFPKKIMIVRKTHESLDDLERIFFDVREMNGFVSVYEVGEGGT